MSFKAMHQGAKVIQLPSLNQWRDLKRDKGSSFLRINEVNSRLTQILHLQILLPIDLKKQVKSLLLILNLLDCQAYKSTQNIKGSANCNNSPIKIKVIAYQ